MSDEATLWDRVRTGLAPYGHLTRLEFNPTAGIPDVDFCILGVEGKIELKHKDDEPSRETTAVFKNGGLRAEQEGWIASRVYHGGRVFVLAQVARRVYLVPGSEAERFNELTLFQLARASVWAEERLDVAKWRALACALIAPEDMVVATTRMRALRAQITAAKGEIRAGRSGAQEGRLSEGGLKRNRGALPLPGSRGRGIR